MNVTNRIQPQLHVNPYFKISEAEFQRRVARLAENVPNLNDEQMTVDIMRIVAAIADGHTTAFSIADPKGPARLPMEMRWLRSDTGDARLASLASLRNPART